MPPKKKARAKRATLGNRVRLSLEQIPEVKKPMPVMKLGGATMAPEKMIQDMVRAVAPNAELKEMGKGGARAAYIGKRLVAFINPATGESRVFPSLETLKPGHGLADRAKSISARIAAKGSLFPKDGTQVVALPPVTLFGVNHSRKGERTAPSEYLSYIRFQRQINGVPVFGPGARAMIAVAADDSIRAFTHRWRSAIPTEQNVVPQSRAKIATLIRTQLAACAKVSDVNVDKVRIGYYDGGQGFLQPVYRFQATIVDHPSKVRKTRTASRHIYGYVSIGAAPEPLPVIGALKGKPPVEPPKQGKKSSRSKSAPPGDPTVGRYVVRNDSDEWVTSANEFFDGLQLAQNMFWAPFSFTDSQYYWAEPRLFTSEKDYFINSVQIALNEVHGNWWYFTTRDNSDDGVSLSDIPSPGYGGAGGGSLAYWIIHSCEVLPTQTDESISFDMWWNIFNGLHAVLGYRTEMWIDDDVTGPFGLCIGLGAPVVSAWLNEVAGNDSYDDGDTYHDGNRNMDEPMGRASAIAVCGHGDDTANDVGSLGPADCLTEWWFEN